MEIGNSSKGFGRLIQVIDLPDDLLDLEYGGLGIHGEGEKREILDETRWKKKS